jgi:hypothetical protein
MRFATCVNTLAFALAATAVSAQTPAAAPLPTSPLSIHLGDADFLPGGFIDATAIVRSTNVGSGMGTSFSSIPFSNTAEGRLSETRLTAQNSRLSLKMTSAVGAAAVKGYVEADFLGGARDNQFVSTNSNAVRMRLAWVQFVKGKFEFLGGQSWSLLTPNRRGLSPEPGDIFSTQVIDPNFRWASRWHGGRSSGWSRTPPRR